MNLYRRSILETSLLVLVALLIAVGVAQVRHKPHRLRATSVAEITIDTHGVMIARLYPITILDDGTYHDANIYKNEPQPMVLDQGVVYEVQKTGQSVGFLTVAKATKEKGDVWTALGKWQLATPPKPQAEATPAPVSSGDERPKLHRPGTQASSPTPTPSSTAAPAATPTPANSGDDRPTLHRPAEAATPTPSPTGATATPAPQATPRDVDPDRPTLRHHSPGQSGSSEMSGTVELAPATSTKPGTPAAASATFSLKPGTQSLVAVSDEQSLDARSFQFVWKPGEEAAVDAKVRRLALAQLTSPGLSEHSLTNVSIRSFDLDLSNDAVMVLTAEIPPGAPAPAKTARGAKSAAPAKVPSSPGATRYITLIARVDFEGEPQKLAFSLTDSSRLDIAPRLELIDAVDVDGDGIAELLFRQYSFDDKSYVVYAIGRSTVTKLFEGASQPLK